MGSRQRREKRERVELPAHEQIDIHVPTTIQPGDRVMVRAEHRGPEGRWWTVEWYPCCDSDDPHDDYADFVYGETFTDSDGREHVTLVNRKSLGYEGAAVPEGPFTVRGVRQPESWVDALVREHRSILWHPQMSGAPGVDRMGHELHARCATDCDGVRCVAVTVVTPMT